MRIPPKNLDDLAVELQKTLGVVQRRDWRAVMRPERRREKQSRNGQK
jgi:hypothetical protein